MATLFPADGQSSLEVLLQGAELYSGRKGLRMDATRLIDGSEGGTAPYNDIPDFSSRMDLALHGPAHTPIGAPITHGELADALHRGSNACALDELPRCFL